MTTTKADAKANAKAILDITLAMADMVKSRGRMPSGELYAMVMGNMSLDSYNQILSTMKDAELVTEKNHELIYTGPMFENRPWNDARRQR